MQDDSPNFAPDDYDKPLSATEIRELIANHLERGLKNLAAEIVTFYGLESEYPNLIAKVDADAKLLSGAIRGNGKNCCKRDFRRS